MSSSRLPASFSSQPQSSADDFGLVAWLEQTRVRLPLRGVEVRFHVAGTLARVEINQVFQNTRPGPLDVTYQFPLPAAASVYRCELIADGRTIVGVVEEQHAAQEQYARAKAEGRRAALVQVRRDNLFNLTLGNVQAAEIVAVRFAYVQELERAVRTIALRIPVCPGERYIPGRPLLRSNQGRGAADDTDETPDASLISPPRIDALHPDAALFYLAGELSAADVAATELVSPSHLLAARAQGDRVSVGFCGEGNLPDRDFILRWELPELAPGTARLLTGTHGGRRYGLLRFTPPAQPVTVRPLPRQLWFLIDRSTSMQGAKWTKTCHALLECVAGLRPEDRVFVTLFENGFQHFAEKPLAPSALLADPRFRALESLGVAGGTEVLPALQEVLRLRDSYREADAATHLVLVTDGEVANEAAVLAALAPHADLSVHTIGIDTAVNDGLLQKMAARHQGRCMLISPNESVAEAVELVLRGSASPTLRRPILAPGVTSPTLLPTNLAGLETSLLVEGEWSDDAPLLTAETASGESWSCSPAVAPGDGEALRLIAAHRAIETLQCAGDRAGAIALAKAANVLCEGAAFLAVDRATKVAVACEELVQPLMDPESFRDSVASCREFAAPAAPCVVPLPLHKRRAGGAADRFRPSVWLGDRVATFEPIRRDPLREHARLLAELGLPLVTQDEDERIAAMALQRWLEVLHSIRAELSAPGASGRSNETDELVRRAITGRESFDTEFPGLGDLLRQLRFERVMWQSLRIGTRLDGRRLALVGAYRKYWLEQLLPPKPVAAAPTSAL